MAPLFWGIWKHLRTIWHGILSLPLTESFKTYQNYWLLPKQGSKKGWKHTWAPGYFTFPLIGLISESSEMFFNFFQVGEKMKAYDFQKGNYHIPLFSVFKYLEACYGKMECTVMIYIITWDESFLKPQDWILTLVCFQHESGPRSCKEDCSEHLRYRFTLPISQKAVTSLNSMSG